MFITNNAFKARFHNLLGDPADHFWVAAELALSNPWFLVRFRITETAEGEDACPRTRTMLLTDVQDVESMAKNEPDEPLLQLESVQIVSPGHLNGTEGWKMEPLTAVWTAEEPSDARHLVHIYEIEGGVRYATSGLETPIDELRNETLWLQFPAPEETRH